MPAFMLFLREEPVRDAEALATYQALNREAVPTLARHGLTPLAVYGATEAVEGEAPDGTIILQFPDTAAARAFYDSPEYQAALPHRLRAATYRAFIVEGL